MPPLSKLEKQDRASGLVAARHMKLFHLFTFHVLIIDAWIVARFRFLRFRARLLISTFFSLFSIKRDHTSEISIIGIARMTTARGLRMQTAAYHAREKETIRQLLLRSSFHVSQRQYICHQIRTTTCVKCPIIAR
jgi:hypothetical protein